jgi:hypothetical protein
MLVEDMNYNRLEKVTEGERCIYFINVRRPADIFSTSDAPW